MSTPAEMHAWNEYDAQRRRAVDFAGDLVPVLDALERLRFAGPQPDPERAHKSLCLVAGELEKVFARHGLESFGAPGDVCEPSTYQVAEVREAPEALRDEVLEVLERGYRFEGQLLRPARVVAAARRHAEDPKETP